LFIGLFVCVPCVLDSSLTFVGCSISVGGSLDCFCVIAERYMFV